ncbi:hypothetical protein MSPP1_003446 [Malassezia sp. CBS 17886]|nr:hypothetical protein MSPP1_003446 [Malassezia sp. CBS 17886]
MLLGLAASAVGNQTFSSPAAQKFLVPQKLPGIPFEVPYSWAGNIPVSAAANETNQLFFWLWAPAGDVGHDDVVVWLNGGPGCSSLEGTLEENGPFTVSVANDSDDVIVKPNPYSWTNLSYVVWIEAPVGVGFTKGEPGVDNEPGLARQFYGFLQQLFATFTELQGKRLWLTGESYAGMYIPYISHEIYSHPANASGIDLQGFAINDPSFTTDFLGEEAPAFEFLETYQKVMNVSTKDVDDVRQVAEKQGVATYVADNLHYPPRGRLSVPEQYHKSSSVWNSVFKAANKTECFNPYMIKPDCRLTKDALGMPLNADEASADNFLNNNADLKKAIHADPDTRWKECSLRGVFKGGGDISAAPDRTVLPDVIEKSKRSVIQHGTYDLVLIANGSALAIQNMTWGGKQGFHTQPHTVLRLDGSARGVFHEERGLTYVQVDGSGHMIPEFKPKVAYKLQNYLLGHVSAADLGHPK